MNLHLKDDWNRRAAVVGRILLAAGLTFAGGLSAATYHVSPDGQDAADGLSETTAFRTVQRAADEVQAGDRIVLGEGIYREYVSVPKSGEEGRPIEIVAADGANPVICGSEVVTNWVPHAGAIWKIMDWPVEPQQVFDNGEPVLKLGWGNRYFETFPHNYGPHPHGPKGLEDMEPNTFYYDKENLIVYLWLAGDADPMQRTVEVSTRLAAINTRNMWGGTNGWYHVRGLTFRHANTVTQSETGWPGVWMGHHSRLDDCRVEWFDSAGFSMGAHSVVENCWITDNGLMGGAAEGFSVIRGCKILRNNSRYFNPAWAAAGMKFIPDLHALVEDCEIAHNRAQGIWFDWCRTGEPITIRRNYIHHNLQNGIFIEISKNASAYNNLLVSNGVRSIYISSSEGTKVYNNTIVDHQSWMTVEMFYDRNRKDPNGETFPLKHNRFVNNIIYGSKALRELVMSDDDLPYCFDNLSDYNCFYRPGGETFVMNRFGNSPLLFTSLADFQNGTGHDLHSLAMDPQFLSKETGDFHLRSPAGTWSNGVWQAAFPLSPAVDTGDPAYGFEEEPDWNGGRVNMGYHGNTSQASRSGDLDADGVSDGLEMYVLHSDPAMAHSDEDTASDYEEYIAGTSPTDPDSVLRVTWHPDEAGEVSGYILSWYGQMGRRYQVESTVGLSPGSWQVHTQHVGVSGTVLTELAGTNGWIRLREPPGTTEPQRIYRVRVLWP